MAGRRGRGAVTRELRPGSISRSLSYPRSRLGRIQPRTDAPAYSGGIDGLAVRTTENFAVSFRASGAWPDLGNVARAATRPRRHHRARRAGPPDVPGGCADCSDATCLELARKIAQHTEPVVEPRRNRRARADVRHVLHRHAGVSVGEMRVVSTSSTTGSNRSADIFRYSSWHARPQVCTCRSTAWVARRSWSPACQAPSSPSGQPRRRAVPGTCEINPLGLQAPGSPTGQPRSDGRCQARADRPRVRTGELLHVRSLHRAVEGFAA